MYDFECPCNKLLPPYHTLRLAIALAGVVLRPSGFRPYLLLHAILDRPLLDSRLFVSPILEFAAQNNKQNQIMRNFPSLTRGDLRLQTDFSMYFNHILRYYLKIQTFSSMVNIFRYVLYFFW